MGATAKLRDLFHVTFQFLIKVFTRSCEDHDHKLSVILIDSISDLVIRSIIEHVKPINARKIAEGLCRGVGKKLGDIININYSWQEIDIYHEFDNCCEEECVADGAAPDINPEDLEASDSVTFTWELA